MTSKHICPKCGGKTFHATAHVTQDWEIDECGNWIKDLDSCGEVTHRPNDDDVWTCANCGEEAVIVHED